MNRTKSSVPPILWVSSALLVVLYLSPHTGWLIRAQLRAPVITLADTRGQGGLSSDEGPPVPARLALPPSADYETGLLMALRTEARIGEKRSRAQLRGLWALATRFPDKPSLYAHILRYSTIDDITLYCQEDYQLAGSAPPKGDEFHPGAAQLATFDRAAAAGEKLDPGNAFFPTMRSAGFLAGRRDRDAIVEAERVSRVKSWNDYIGEEDAAFMQAEERAGFPTTGIEQLVAFASTSLPHFGVCRVMGRIMAHKAAGMEASGHREEGLRLRHAIMNIGASMRCNCSTFVGNRAGIEIARTAALRAGGTPLERPDASLSREQRRQLLLEHYTAYLRQSGQTGEARWVLAEETAGKQVLALRVAGEYAVVALIIHWLIDLGLLANALWLQIFVGMAVTRWRRSGWLLLLAASSLFVLLGVWCFQCRWVDPLYYFFRCVHYSEGGPGLDPIQKLGVLALSMAAPLLLLTVVAIKSRIRRNPLRPSLISGLQTIAPTLTGILLLSYAGMIVLTGRLEDQVQSDLHRRSIHTGRFMAEMSHQEWPGSQSAVNK